MVFAAFAARNWLLGGAGSLFTSAPNDDYARGRVGRKTKLTHKQYNLYNFQKGFCGFCSVFLNVVCF